MGLIENAAVLLSLAISLCTIAVVGLGGVRHDG